MSLGKKTCCHVAMWQKDGGNPSTLTLTGVFQPVQINFNFQQEMLVSSLPWNAIPVLWASEWASEEVCVNWWQEWVVQALRFPSWCKHAVVGPSLVTVWLKVGEESKSWGTIPHTNRQPVYINCCVTTGGETTLRHCAIRHVMLLLTHHTQAYWITL